MVIFLSIFTASLVLLVIIEILSINAANRNYVRLGQLPANNSKISIVIAARNEEDSLRATLESIENQKDSNFELIIVLDRCSDSTATIAASFLSSKSIDMHIIENTAELPVGNSPKMHLLKKAFAMATGDIYLLTDADCIVPSNWLSQYRMMFSDNTVGLAMGAVETFTTGSLLSAFQSFDHIYRAFYSAGCCGAGVPTGGYGNNMAISRECYEFLGGFDNLPPSVTEDAVLISSVRESGKYKVVSTSSNENRVIAKPVIGFKAYYAQILRWATGAVRSPDVKTRLYYNLLMATLTLSNLSLVLAVIFPVLILLPAAVNIYYFTSAIIAGIYMHAGRAYWRHLIPSIFLFFFFYQISFIGAITRRKIIWKESTLLHKL